MSCFFRTRSNIVSFSFKRALLVFFLIYPNISAALPESRVYVCFANRVNDDEISNRMALAQGGFLMPTLLINDYFARLFLVDRGIVTDLRDDYIELKFNDLISDDFTELFSSRYRGQIASSVLDLFIISEPPDKSSNEDIVVLVNIIKDERYKTIVYVCAHEDRFNAEGYNFIK